MARLKAAANKPHYLVSEIFQAVDTPEQDGKVKKDMDSLKAQLACRRAVRRRRASAQPEPHRRPGRRSGRRPGRQLPPELDKVLKTMHSGQISRADPRHRRLLHSLPARTAGCRKVRNFPRKRWRRHRRPGGHVALRAYSSAVAAEAVQGADPTRGTGRRGDARPDPKLHRGQTNRGQASGCQFHEPRQHAARRSQCRYADRRCSRPDQAASRRRWFRLPASSFIVRCDKAPPQIGTVRMPSRDQVEQSIYEEQISTLSRQYLRDLRRDADVETRRDELTHRSM